MDGVRDLGPPPETAAKLWKSWTTHRVQPSQVLYDTEFRHMLPTPATLHAQDSMKTLQGRDGIWFAGGYLYPYDSQETALRSALRVALGLDAVVGAEPAALGRKSRRGVSLSATHRRPGPARGGGEESLRVALLGRRQHLVDRPLLADGAAVEHDHAVGDARDDAEVVRDEEQRRRPNSRAGRRAARSRRPAPRRRARR